MAKSRYTRVLAGTQADSTQVSQPWDLDQLPDELLISSYRAMSEFVDWLRGPVGITVPDCWYFHGWSARRVAALMAWHGDTNGAKATGHGASEWWASLWGLAGLREDWKELAGHNGRHGKDVAMPSLTEFVEALIAERAA